MRAIDVMTPSVVVASPDMTVREVARLMAEHRISGMPVLDSNGNIAGIVTEGDLLRRVEIGTDSQPRPWWSELFASTRDLASSYVREHARTVKDVMTTDVLSVSGETPLAEVADLLERKQIKRVPVLQEGKLIGIVSRANLIRVLASVLPDEAVAEGDDEVIRDAVLRELAGHRWEQPPRNVLVKDGVVHLWGVVRSEEEKRAICVAAESVPGVRRVKPHFEYPAAPMPSL